MQRLTARARLFAERTQDPFYKTHVDAYLSVYRTNSSRRNATVNAARIYKHPLVKAYLQELHAKRLELVAQNLNDGKYQHLCLRMR